MAAATPGDAITYCSEMSFRSRRRFGFTTRHKQVEEDAWLRFHACAGQVLEARPSSESLAIIASMDSEEQKHTRGQDFKCFPWAVEPTGQTPWNWFKRILTPSSFMCRMEHFNKSLLFLPCDENSSMLIPFHQRPAGRSPETGRDPLRAEFKTSRWKRPSL